MGGRGASSGGKLLGRTTAQDKAIKRYARRTANLKNEQYRIFDADGNVLLEKRGDVNSVAATVGEKRQYLNGNISLHNHPEGGTFSADDLSEFGFGAKELVVASPEGTYRLINKKVGTPEQYNGWYDMREALQGSIPEVSTTSLLRQAQANLQNSKAVRESTAIAEKWAKIRAKQGAEAANRYYESVNDRYKDLQKKHKAEVDAEIRRLEVKPYHDWYKANAKKYGFDYRFDKG